MSSAKIRSRVKGAWDSRSVSPLARRVRRSKLTYLSWGKLRTLERCVEIIDEEGVAGDFIEAGVALGGSSILISSRLDGDRSFAGYDVFGQIPPPSDRDPDVAHERYAKIAAGDSPGLGDDTYYGYVADLYDRVVANFADFGIEVDGSRVALHRGLFEDTLRPTASVALAHIDADWYEPVRTCLERIYPHLSVGGFFVLDDYNDYGGCAEATDEFRAAHPDLVPQKSQGSYVLRRSAG